MNRLWWQDDKDSIRFRTLADMVVREGKAITDHIDAKKREIFKANHFDPETGQPEEGHPLAAERPEVPSLPAAEIEGAIAEYNAVREDGRRIDEHQLDELFEDSSKCVNVSVDDVGVTEQKPTGRCKNPPKREHKHYVRNTVIHIQQELGKYVLDGIGIRDMLLVLTAFLLHNGLSDKMIVFFTDGAGDIRNPIKEVFGWTPFKIILDWYHLKKKCQELLSMGLKGREIKNVALKELLSLLWLGKWTLPPYTSQTWPPTGEGRATPLKLPILSNTWRRTEATSPATPCARSWASEYRATGARRRTTWWWRSGRSTTA
jgi:hypothetical protein